MKNSSLIINVFLAVAVVTLYALHFTTRTNSTQQEEMNIEAPSLIFDGEGVAVAWVNTDSVLANYDMYFDIQKDIEEKERRMESDMTLRFRDLEKQMIDLDERYKNRLVTTQQAQKQHQELTQKEQELYRYWEELRMQHTEEQQVMLRRIYQSLYDYLKEYNKDKGYQLIFSSSFGGPILYGSKAIEITDDVLRGLNEEYLKSKSIRK